MKDRKGYETEITQSYKTATGIIRFPGKGRVQKKTFRSTVYCSAKTKAAAWIKETIENHAQASRSESSHRIRVIQLETEWMVSANNGHGFELKSRHASREDAMNDAYDWLDQGMDVIVEQVVST